MRLILLFTAFWAALSAAACAPQTPRDGPGALLVLEVAMDSFEATSLKQLSTNIREELRRQPSIPLNPLGGRKIEGDRVLITPGDASNMDAATARIGKLGDIEIAAANGTIAAGFSDAALRAKSEAQLDEVIKTIARRLDASGFPNADIQKLNGQVVVRIPGLTDPKVLKAIEQVLNVPGVLTFNLVDESADPGNFEVGVEKEGRIALPDDSFDGTPLVVFADAVITGADLKSASQSFDLSNQPSIVFALNEDGTRRFGRATTENINRRFAIVLDNRIITAPNIRSPITGGSGTIEGSFKVEEAERIAIVLRSGALPLGMRVIESRLYEAAPKP